MKNFSRLFYFFILLISTNALSNHYWSFDQWLNSLKAPEFDIIEDVQEMKKTFFNYLLPEINKKNNEIKSIRKKVIEKDL